MLYICEVAFDIYLKLSDIFAGVPTILSATVFLMNFDLRLHWSNADVLFSFYVILQAL